MSRKGYGFSDRFPHFGLFLVVTLAIAIPLTVWSLNHTSTVFVQQAQIPRCGSNNSNPSCPVDYSCIYTNNNAILGGNCMLKYLKSPSNLKYSATCQYNPDIPNQAELSLSWNSVDNANGYKISGSYYHLDQGNLNNIKIGPYGTFTNSYTLSIPLPHNVRYFYWNVEAYNSSFNVNSQPSEISTVVLNCH
jgi:hypothetical protein